MCFESLERKDMKYGLVEKEEEHLEGILELPLVV